MSQLMTYIRSSVPIRTGVELIKFSPKLPDTISFLGNPPIPPAMPDTPWVYDEFVL